MNLNVDLMINSLPLLIVGAGITIQITAISVGLGLIIGMFVGIARICNVKVLRALATVYIDFLRGTPLLVQIFLIYFALPMVVGQRVDPFIAAITACGINSVLLLIPLRAAHMAEEILHALVIIEVRTEEISRVPVDEHTSEVKYDVLDGAHVQRLWCCACLLVLHCLVLLGLVYIHLYPSAAAHNPSTRLPPA